MQLKEIQTKLSRLLHIFKEARQETEINRRKLDQAVKELEQLHREVSHHLRRGDFHGHTA